MGLPGIAVLMQTGQDLNVGEMVLAPGAGYIGVTDNGRDVSGGTGGGTGGPTPTTPALTAVEALGPRQIALTFSEPVNAGSGASFGLYNAAGGAPTHGREATDPDDDIFVSDATFNGTVRVVIDWRPATDDLVAGVTYYAQIDAGFAVAADDGRASAVETGTGITFTYAGAGGGSVPVLFNARLLSNATAGQASVAVDTDSGGDGPTDVVLSSSATAPSALQIDNGTVQSGATLLGAATAATGASGVTSLIVPVTASAGAAYAHFTQRGAGGRAVPVTAGPFAITAAASSPFTTSVTDGQATHTGDLPSFTVTDGQAAQTGGT
jgi:hypothetical protein